MYEKKSVEMKKDKNHEANQRKEIKGKKKTDKRKKQKKSNKKLNKEKGSLNHTIAKLFGQLIVLWVA